MVLIKIAWRNVLRHPGKSLIVGALIFFCVFLMSTSKAVIAGMERGLVENVARKYTGDIVVVSNEQRSDNVFLDYLGKPVEPIYNYPTIEATLSEMPMVGGFVAVGKNMALILTGDGAPGWTYLWGVDFAKYKKCFGDNYEIIEGRGDILSGGILLPADKRKQVNELSNVWYIPSNCTLVIDNIDIAQTKENLSTLIERDEMVLMGFNAGNYASDKALRIHGIIKYGLLNTFFRHFALVDIESYRECMGYITNKGRNVVLSDTQSTLLNMSDDDYESLFSGKAMPTGQFKEMKSEDARDKPDESTGVYNMIFVRLKGSQSSEKAAGELNRIFSEKSLGVRAIPWKKALQYIGSISVFIKTMLYLFSALVFFISIFIIMNNVSITVLDRTSEIGMMRTIGAGKWAIRGIFIYEVLIISIVFGALGILLSYGVVELVQNLDIRAGNYMVEIFFGGKYFTPRIVAVDVAMTCGLLLLASTAAVVYPAKYASDIPPVSAVNKN